MPDSKQYPNPFRSSILTDPWQSSVVDVPQIHGKIFNDSCRALETIRHELHSTSVLIHGSAGAGKTHLLSRLRRALQVSGPPDRPFTGRETLFSWVRLNSSPGMLWRHVRRKIVEDLLRPEVAASQLLRVLICRLFIAWPAEGDLDLWWEYATSELPDELENIVDQLAESSGLPHDLTIILRHVVRGRYKSESRAWLRGDSLSEATLSQLGLSQEPPESDPEQTSRELVLALCRLIEPVASIVLGFDQVEALQIHPEDLSGLHTFGQLVSVLHDETHNILIISCVQSAFAASLKERAIGADYDRMKDFGLWQLSPLNWDEAVQLVSARMRAVPELVALRNGQPDPLWPLAEADVRTCLSDGKSTTPRVLLAHCGRLFDDWQQGAGRPAEPSLDGLLAEAWSAQLAKSRADNGPQLSEAILTDALPRLLQIVQPAGKVVRDTLLLDVDLVWQNSSQENIGFSGCLQEHMTSLAARLKRLRQQLDMDRLARLVVLRDQRIEISKNAKKVREHLGAFDANLVQVIELTAESFAELDCLRMLLGDASSGDLASQGQTVSTAAAETWLATNLSPNLADLANQLLSPPAPRAAGERQMLEIQTRWVTAPK